MEWLEVVVGVGDIGVLQLGLDAAQLWGAGRRAQSRSDERGTAAQGRARGRAGDRLQQIKVGGRTGCT